MWRRALLTAAAVSCTLPTNASAHRTPRLTQIQDLICVLILSGIQKEDLDVSMLGKLRRYNVNLDDINNEQIRQQCVSRNNELTKGELMEIKDSYVSTTEYNPTISTKLLPSQNLNMDSVMSYLKTREDSDRNSDALTRRTISTNQEMVTDVVEVIKNEPKIDMDSLRRFIQLETQKNSFYKIDDDSETAKDDKTFNIKTNQKNSLVTDDAKIIDKIIKDYLLKEQKIPTTTEHSITRFAIDMQKIYKQIDEIIANGTDVDNEKVKHIVNYPDKGEGTTKHNVISPPVTPLSQLSSYPTGKQFFESFFKFLNEMNQFKNNSSRPFQTNDNNVNHKDTPQKDKLLEPLIQKDQENKTETTTKKVKSEKEPDKRALTPSLVKEIAETVKNVIIKDLRDELAGIYVQTTQTTTQITSTTIRTTTETVPKSTFKTTIKENDMAIMDKFMELYEQIKSLKQTSYLLKASNESTNLVNKLKRADNIPREGVMIMPAVKGLQIQEPKVFISSVDNYNTKPVFNYNPYLPRRENIQLPITIQTNSVEIQPLPVPVSKPESIISQNIVVHTGNRYQHKDNFKYLNSRGTKFSRYTDTDHFVNNHNRTFNYSPLKRYEGYKSERYPLNLQEPKPIEDVIRFRVRDNGNSRLDTDYYEKINFGNSHNNVNNKHGIFTNHKYPKFHERLERVDPGSDGTPIVSDVDIKNKNEQISDFPSRHQLSLVDMKKGTSYDDTHFKNFLRSQQKVTDMLERILATRPKNNTPRSVETV